MSSRIPFNIATTHDRLHDVWIAAYGAAYAEEVGRFERLAEESGYPRPGGYDSALDFARSRASAERAATIANDAVRKLEKWFHDGNGNWIDADP